MRENLNEGRVLVDFFADWCGPCKMLKPTVTKFAEEQSDVNVVMINVDEHVDITTEFGIRSIPTLLYMEDGKVVERAVGTKTLEELYTFTQVN
jgi:thioredoxin 1